MHQHLLLKLQRMDAPGASCLRCSVARTVHHLTVCPHNIGSSICALVNGSSACGGSHGNGSVSE